MNAPTSSITLKAKDYATDQEVRWCPGCGDYAILKGVQKSLADMQVSRENTVFVSGIGCAARFPYYIDTYGFHTIHGRAPAIATGIKLANPELDVWIVGGDGDNLSIGGNHLIHILRRNVDVQLLLFNNEIYGLTKGQFSPTSKVGTRSPSTPLGSVDRPLSATELALGAGARFVARTVDTQQKHMPVVLHRAHSHRGASFVEIFQNCIVYNADAFSGFTDRDVALERQIDVQHGQPLIYGKDKDKGLRLDRDKLRLECVTIGQEGVTEDDILVHDETNRQLAQLLAAMKSPEFPVAIGVLFADPAPTYESAVWQQIDAAKTKNPDPDFNSLLRSGHTWSID